MPAQLVGSLRGHGCHSARSATCCHSLLLRPHRLHAVYPPLLHPPHLQCTEAYRERVFPLLLPHMCLNR